MDTNTHDQALINDFLRWLSRKKLDLCEYEPNSSNWFPTTSSNQSITDNFWQDHAHKTVCFTGKRPKDLLGYANHSGYVKMVHQFETLVGQLVENNYTTFITGGAQGFDQLMFWAVHTYKQQHTDKNIRNVVFVPFDGQEIRWSKTGEFSQADYAKMLSLANEVHYITNINADSASHVDIIRAMSERNNAMLKKSDLVIGLYPDDTWTDPTTKGGTAQTLRMAHGVCPSQVIHYNKDDVIDSLRDGLLEVSLSIDFDLG